MLEQFSVGLYKFVLEAKEQGLELPPFYGSTFRGAFGMAFKKIACANPALTSCHDCLLEKNCPYAYIFETAPPEGVNRLKGYSDIPRPFMLFPKLEDRVYYAPGEQIEIEVRLFGRGNDYLPYFILAFVKMEEQGLGYRRKPFRLRKVIGFDLLSRVEQMVYDGENNKVFSPKHILTGQDLFIRLPREAHRVKVDFLTPIRLKEEGKLVTTVEFHHLARSLLRRASMLMLVHHDAGLELDYTGWAEQSRLVKRIRDFSAWHDLERYSQRQRGKMLLGGVVGEVTYEGDLSRFLPLLEFGRWAGAGKNNVFGLGQMDYVVEE
ncbi:MAG: CRISPR system precrRNA processing endoribonuclease RAMP protein Cas6 [Desulfitobacteriaceae bacterium]